MERVEFVSYTGTYPNHCRGVLTVKINGEIVKFGHNYSNVDFNDDGNLIFKDEIDCPNQEPFWHSGGSCGFDSQWNSFVDYGEWEMDIEELDEKYWDFADELIEVFNANVAAGCCGGCL